MYVKSIYVYVYIYIYMYMCVCAPYSSKQLLRLDLELIFWVQRPSQILVFGARGIYVLRWATGLANYLVNRS